MRNSHHLVLQLVLWRSSNQISDSYAMHGKKMEWKKYENKYGKRNANVARINEHQPDSRGG